MLPFYLTTEELNLAFRIVGLQKKPRHLPTNLTKLNLAQWEEVRLLLEELEFQKAQSQVH